jgi:hypothetical protein
MRFTSLRLRSRLGIAAFGTAILAATATSVALAAPARVSPPLCYARCPSTTVLSLSSHIVASGSEQKETFRVFVRSGVFGLNRIPQGTVAVKYQRVTLCTLTLTNGMGRCSPSRDALPARGWVYVIRAYYSGNVTFSASTSPGQALLVVKPRLFTPRSRVL